MKNTVPYEEIIKNIGDWDIEKYSPKPGHNYFRYRNKVSRNKVKYVGTNKKYELVLNQYPELKELNKKEKVNE